MKHVENMRKSDKIDTIKQKSHNQSILSRKWSDGGTVNFFFYNYWNKSAP